MAPVGCYTCLTVCSKKPDPLRFGGAPAIASSSGAFIAGQAAKPVRTSGDLGGGNPHPPSCDDAWKMQVESQWRLGEPPMPATPVDSIGTPAKDLMPTEESETKTPMVTEDDQTKASSAPMATEVATDDKTKSSNPAVIAGQDDSAFEATQKDLDNELGLDDHSLGLGSSPGSPQESSAPSATPTTAAPNKFDKYYHQTLSSKLMLMREA